MKFADKIAIAKPQLLHIARFGEDEFSHLSTSVRQMQSLSDKSRTLIQSLLLTAAHEGAVALSGNQCGLQMSVFVMLKQLKRNTWFYTGLRPEDYEVIINPKVLWHGKVGIPNKQGELRQVEWEECTSFPYMMAKMTRIDEIRVAYRDLNFHHKELPLQDFRARVFLHEIDHLQGKLLGDDLNCLLPSHRSAGQQLVHVNVKKIATKMLHQESLIKSVLMRQNQTDK